jgi:hypothetical protein
MMVWAAMKAAGERGGIAMGNLVVAGLRGGYEKLGMITPG